MASTDTLDLLQKLFSEPLILAPANEQRFGATTVNWWHGKPGDAIIMAHGGSFEDRTMAEQIVAAQLVACGYKRAQFNFDRNFKTANWTDIMAKAKRLIQSGNVTMLRNGWNNIVGHVVGDHGEYTTEIGRDDPKGRAITTWTCECPWDQYAWQRTRKWKKYEGRPCAHVLALYWKALSTPLDEGSPDGSPVPPGQVPPAPPAPDGGGGAPPTMGPEPAAPGMPAEPEPVPAGAQGPGVPAPMAPPGAPGVLPPSPADQLAMMQPPIPGATPSGQPASPSVVSVPGAKMPGPFNPIQYPGGTYSKVSADFEAPQIVRLKEEVYGNAVGKSEAHGAGQYRLVPEGSTGEVLGQDTTTGWVEVIFPIDDAGPMEPYHVQCFVEPSQIENTRIRPPGPFIKRRSNR